MLLRLVCSFSWLSWPLLGGFNDFCWILLAEILNLLLF